MPELAIPRLRLAPVLHGGQIVYLLLRYVGSNEAIECRRSTHGHWVFQHPWSKQP